MLSFQKAQQYQRLSALTSSIFWYIVTTIFTPGLGVVEGVEVVAQMMAAKARHLSWHDAAL